MYVNISDNATFSMQAHESERVYRVEVRLLVGGFRKLVFAIHLYDWQKPLPSPYDQRYLDRVVFSADQNVTDGLRDFNVTIVDIQSDDNGTYIVQKHPRLSNGTCFIVYVLGKRTNNDISKYVQSMTLHKDFLCKSFIPTCNLHVE